MPQLSQIQGAPFWKVFFISLALVSKLQFKLQFLLFPALSAPIKLSFHLGELLIILDSFPV